MGVAVGGLDLEYALAELEDGNVEGAAAEIVDGDGLFLLLVLVETVGEGGGGRLVDDTLDLEAGDLARVLRRLSLRVIEIGGDGDDGFGDRFAEIVFGRLLHLLEDEGRDFLGTVGLARGVDSDVRTVVENMIRHELGLVGYLRILAPHEALDRVHGVLGIGDHLVLRRGADDALSLGGEADDRGSRTAALRICDDDWLPAFHDRYAAVGRSEIDSNDPTHIQAP